MNTEIPRMKDGVHRAISFDLPSWRSSRSPKENGSVAGLLLSAKFQQAGGVAQDFTGAPGGLGDGEEWNTDYKILEPGPGQAVPSHGDQRRTERQRAGADPQQ